jgi:uncharacterized protein (DUF2062 family)/trans-aconitate methyltransferase
MLKFQRRLTAAIYRYRTEGDTPIGQALAIGVGLFIGCTPFIGFHLAMAIGAGWLFGLNRFKVYVAANISNPLFAPFLYALEIQVGTWLRTGQFLSASTIGDVRLRGLAVDILLGSLVVGAILGVAGFLVTYWGSGRRTRPEETALVEAAAERYLARGVLAWEMARNKLRLDPVYLQVLKDGRLPERGLLLDLGCGPGLMLALIVAARDRWHRGLWPAAWPKPPIDLRLHGIDNRPRVARRAQAVLQDAATIEERDLSQSSIPPCDAILLFDVLHLLPRGAQDRLLAMIASSLSTGGVLLIREADADAGWKFQMVRFGNRFNGIMQGKFSRRFCFDSVTGWSARLAQGGFAVESVTRHDQGVFGNVFLQARKV